MEGVGGRAREEGTFTMPLTLLKLSVPPKPSVTSIPSTQVNFYPSFKGTTTNFLDTHNSIMTSREFLL